MIRLSCSVLLDMRDLVQITQNHGRYKVVLATLVGLIQAARIGGTVLVSGRVGSPISIV